MLVHNRMSQRVITVEPHVPLEQARALLHRHRIRQLPVMRKDRLVGIVTDRDLRGAGGNDKTVADIMSPKPLTVAPTASVDEAARLLSSHKIGALPVLDGGKLVGILSSSDVLDAFVDLSGVGEPTYRMMISGAKGKLAAHRVREIIVGQRGELKWMHPDSADSSKLHLRLRARRIDDITTGLEAAGFNVDAVVAPGRSRA
jgi:acetoin utilization protein AcuB